MKTNIETNSNSDIAPVTQKLSLRSKGLKAVLVVLSLTALGLSYRAATEAVALYGVLEKVQATLATEQTVKAQAASPVQISETKPAVAGL